jgi:hypothetical protein
MSPQVFYLLVLANPSSQCGEANKAGTDGLTTGAALR